MNISTNPFRTPFSDVTIKFDGELIQEVKRELENHELELRDLNDVSRELLFINDSLLEMRKIEVLGNYPDTRTSENYFNHYCALTDEMNKILCSQPQQTIRQKSILHTKFVSWLTLSRTYGTPFLGNSLVREIEREINSSGVHKNLHPENHYTEADQYRVYPKKALGAVAQATDVFCHSYVWERANRTASLLSKDSNDQHRLATEDFLILAELYGLSRQGGREFNINYLEKEVKEIICVQDRQREGSTYSLLLGGKFKGSKNRDYYVTEAGHFSQLTFNTSSLDASTGKVVQEWENFQVNRDENGSCRILRIQTNLNDLNDEAGKVHLEFDEKHQFTSVKEMLQLPTWKDADKTSGLSKIIYQRIN